MAKSEQASIAHHIQRHHGNPELFWRGELVSLCKQCHDSDAQSIEKGGKPRRTIGADGWPIEGMKRTHTGGGRLRLAQRNSKGGGPGEKR